MFIIILMYICAEKNGNSALNAQNFKIFCLFHDRSHCANSTMLNEYCISVHIVGIFNPSLNEYNVTKPANQVSNKSVSFL